MRYLGVRWVWIEIAKNRDFDLIGVRNATMD